MYSVDEETWPFSDRELARRLERAEAKSNANFIEARAKALPACGAEWIEVAGAYAMFDTVTSPVTQTFGLGLFDKVNADDMERLETFFRNRQAPVCHEISPLADSSLLTMLCQRGYRPVELSSVLYRPIPRQISMSAVNPRIRVRLMADNEFELWSQISARGWSHIPEVVPFLLEIGVFQIHRSNSKTFIAELDGQPVATGVLCIHDGVALLAGACTVPEARRQGAQLALLQGRLGCAAEQGCDIAMMCAQEPGGASQRNAERHGFRLAYTRIKWRLI
jgi:hypothetical protein